MKPRVAWVYGHAVNRACGAGSTRLFFALFKSVMAVFAKGLPIFRVPKEDGVSTVWSNVVHHSGGDQHISLLMHVAQRVPLQEAGTRFRPSAAIESRRSVHALLRERA